MSDAQSLTPQDAGFYLPAEWAPHAATWFAWPHCSETWPGHLREAENTIARCVSHLARAPESISERIEILVQKPSDADRIKRILAFWDTNLARVHFHPFPTNDVWIRDYGPTFLVRDDNADDGLGTLALVDWRFDGWGEKERPTTVPTMDSTTKSPNELLKPWTSTASKHNWYWKAAPLTTTVQEPFLRPGTVCFIDNPAPQKPRSSRAWRALKKPLPATSERSTSFG